MLALLPQPGQSDSAVPVKKLLPTLPSLLDTPEIPLIHRDLSWLQFNERVLEQARPTSQNLPGERAKFLAISASNLDEFFMIRFAALEREIARHQMDSELVEHHERLRDLVLENVARFGARQSEILEFIATELSRYGLKVVLDFRESEAVYQLGQATFDAHIRPHLPKRMQPLDDRRLARWTNLQLIAAHGEQNHGFAIPSDLPKMYESARTPDGEQTFMFLDLLLLTYLPSVYGEDAPTGILRITRDGDIATTDEGGATPDDLRRRLSRRDHGRPVRLQYVGNLQPEYLTSLAGRLTLRDAQVLPAPTTLGLADLWTVVRSINVDHPRAPDLVYPDLPNCVPSAFRDPKALFDQVRRYDLLMHHPYDSFEAFLSWIETACHDPAVESIEMTVYRLGALSPLVKTLCGAAKKKKIRMVIELRARFDEAVNLALSEELARAGVDVTFGFGRLKVHAKMTLVTRREGEALVRYTHLSTGNYNHRTARQYADLAILTCNPEIGQDARIFFDAVSRGEVPKGFKQLVLAPTNLHKRLLALIHEEIQAAQRGVVGSRIVAKVNALVDEQVIASLYRASQAGVKVDLIVRGACSLIPGVAGLSKNIRVISIVDRFLEHSRVYYFGSSRRLYFSSADWMPRNFFNRLEIAFPVLDGRILSYVESVFLPTQLQDTVKARELTAQGVWKKRASRSGTAPVRAQFVFIDQASKDYAGTPLAPP